MSKPWCKHYRGMHEKTTCEAGVVFKELSCYGADDFFDICPCFGPNGSKCDKAEYPTAEEMAAHDEEMKVRFENTCKARDAIIEHLGGPWKRGTASSSGQIDCPVCLGEESLRFSRAGYNGHIHAKCKTEGCVYWME